ncbi:anthranilate synthase component I family protein [Brevundimonas sp.]|uniref:anthranilate synthase component I family protein n=1 Tax=Brevundimonas sp. TaxID=1871086 RepID=UPI002E1291CB|nr:anthranilate synthase component I family protein [Brevundimonas sp.]
MSAPFAARHDRPLGRIDAAAVAAGLRDRPGALVLTAPAGGGRSLVAADPDLTFSGPVDDAAPFARLADPLWSRGVVGLASYDLGARPAVGPRGDWPDLTLARYPAMIEIDADGHAVAVGRGATAADAEQAALLAESWTSPSPRGEGGSRSDPGGGDAATHSPPAAAFPAEAPGSAYEAAVADVVARIAAGELFQANVARAWSGALREGADPWDVFARLSDRASAYGGFWRMGDRALASNSPELFLTLDRSTRRVETRPIKGTRPRAPDPVRDAALAAELQASAKDRAENLMIVDLMRNDLARACLPGSVRVERLFELEAHPTVHHLVSTVTGTLTPDAGPAELMTAAFPPGSITGAPKHQAMKVIAGHEAARGPWCGSLFLAEEDRFTASVLIRTVGFERENDAWRWRTLAGAGVTADSDPRAELEETEAKIAALRRALAVDQGV